MMKSVIFIPSRKESTRFPNKPMAKILGETLIYRVWRIAKQVKSASDIIITTDSIEIKDHCESFGATVILTSTDCINGTDRIAEAFKIYKQEIDIVVNFQGDAPLTPPWIIDNVLHAMQKDPNILIATPMHALTGQELHRFLDNKSKKSLTGTTVVFDKNHYALYFSKGVIPNYRTPQNINTLFQHIGLYAYKSETLMKLQSIPPSNLEQIEGLEQLRALENHIPIKMVEVDLKDRSSWSVDHKNDVKIVEKIIQAEGELVL